MAEETYYWNMVERNIGMLGRENQEILKNTIVPIFGVGGGGGVVAELLTRSGIGGLRIVDIDCFEPSNLNRQLFSYQSTLGKQKVDMAEKFLQDINPSLTVEKFHETNDETIEKMLDGAPLAVMCIDKIVPSIHVARHCSRKNITMIETVVIPYLNVRVYTRDTISFEKFHGFATENKTMEELYHLNADEMTELSDCFIRTFAGLDKITGFYRPEAMQDMRQGKFSTLAPLVWLQGALTAMETIKILLDWGSISYVPEYALYDPFLFRIPDPVNPSLAPGPKP